MTRVNRTGASTFLGENGLPIAPNTLAKKAVDGSGPPYQIWNGRATYDSDDLVAWAQKQLGPKLHNTAERSERSKASKLESLNDLGRGDHAGDNEPINTKGVPVRHAPINSSSRTMVSEPTKSFSDSRSPEGVAEMSNKAVE
jgi:hypothetical protein